ncbi:MAG: division/cell wall cluster transcriptional repressor MraZ [Oscillospiraceae bacterium]|nr:division/cell wall cluster transcriptional repressor MraZ [Oscillospiraceae bacterium]
MAAIIGDYAHTLDAKGRLFIPAKLRDELGSVFYVTVSPEECLRVYSSESWDRLMEKLKALPYSKQQGLRPLFAKAARCELDAQGRINLPQNLRDFAELKKDVAIVGAGNHAEIWDAGKWTRVMTSEATPENIAAMMEEFEF